MWILLFFYIQRILWGMNCFCIYSLAFKISQYVAMLMTCLFCTLTVSYRNCHCYIVKIFVELKIPYDVILMDLVAHEWCPCFKGMKINLKNHHHQVMLRPNRIEQEREAWGWGLDLIALIAMWLDTTTSDSRKKPTRSHAACLASGKSSKWKQEDFYKEWTWHPIDEKISFEWVGSYLSLSYRLRVSLCGSRAPGTIRANDHREDRT